MNQALGWIKTTGRLSNFPRGLEHFRKGRKPLFSHGFGGIYSMKTGYSEASSNSAIATLNIRTARGEVRTGRKALPNSVQIVIEAVPINRKITTWSTMLSGN